MYVKVEHDGVNETCRHRDPGRIGSIVRNPVNSTT